MPLIEELDEDGNVVDEDGCVEETQEEMEEKDEGKRRWREKLAAMEKEEKERVEIQFSAAEEQRNAGNERLAQSDIEGACESYEQALSDLTLVGNEPENRTRAEKANTALHLNLALALLKLHRYEDVKFQCSSALLADVKNVKALYRRGLAQAALARNAALFQEAEAQAACADFEAALAAEPANAEAQRELAKLRAELRAHERDLAKKQKETWSQVFGGKTVIEGEEDLPPPPPPPTVRPCKNTNLHLVVSAEGAGVVDGQGRPVLSDLSMELRQSWCVGLTGGEPVARSALGRLLSGEAKAATGRVVVHPKEPKPGRRKDPEPIDSSFLFGGAALLLAMMAATELAPGVPNFQKWTLRIVFPPMLYLIYLGWRYSQACKAPLSVHAVVASPEAAALLAKGAKSSVEDLIGTLLARQLSKEERRERVIAMLAAAGFKGTGEDGVSPATYVERGLLFGELPLKQQRLVQICICIAQRPEVLIIDGALEGLHVDNQARILRMLKRLKQECKTSILCMSSDLEQVCYLADSLAVLSPEGSLCEKGPSLEVLETPRHETTQAIIAALLERSGEKEVGGPIQAHCKELLGNADLDGPWIPPKYT
mmetsp:Transcript_6753/g.16914  ORF Transcript_6753/g.16914 Transcript_6753/m.16914 type:complete len:599 (-) Transcript_6753:70-1866(-)